MANQTLQYEKWGRLHYFYYNYLEDDAKEDGAAKDWSELHAELSAKKLQSTLFGEKGKKVLAQYTQTKQSMISSGDLDEFGKVLDALGHLGGDGIMEPKNSSAGDDSFSEGYNSVTISDFSPQQAMSEACEKGKNLVEQVNMFKEALESKIEEIASLVGTNVEEYKKQLIEAYTSHKGVPSSEWAKNFYADFMKSEGLRSFQNRCGGASKLSTVLDKLILLAEALPELGESEDITSGTYSTHSSKGDITDTNFGKIIAGKVQGLWSNTKGEAGEIASVAGFAKAFEDALAAEGEAVRRVIDEKSKKVLASDEWEITVEQSGTSQTTNFETGQKNVSKPDVQITISKGETVIKYGATVKNYKIDPSGKTRGVSLATNTPFWEALVKHVKSSEEQFAVVQLAAGHAGTHIADIGKENKKSTKIKGTGTSDKILNESWDDIVQGVTLLNAVDALVGVKTKEGYQNLYYVKNGTVTRIEEIIQQVADGSAARFIGKITQGSSNKKLFRGTLKNLNAWEKSDEGYYSTDVAWKRSSAAKSAIMAELRAAKLSISLNEMLN